MWSWKLSLKLNDMTMKARFLLLAAVFAVLQLPAQTAERYIEVRGTAEMEIVPDEIH